MTKVEITNKINNYLSNRSVAFTDLLGNTIRVDSYEKYVHELSLIKNTFGEDIPEFTEEAIKYLEKMNEFIEKCSEAPDIATYIDSNLIRHIYGPYSGSPIRATFVSPNSLLGTTEHSVQALKQIYDEMGMERLNQYIELLKNPSSLSSWLSDTKKQLVAMHYILFATDHHSKSRLQRNHSTESLYKLTKASIDDALNEITTQKNEYVSFMNQEKENYLSWSANAKAEHEQLLETHQTKYSLFIAEGKQQLYDIDTTYKEKLKVEKPAEHMKTEAEKYKGKSIKWAIGTIILSIILIILLGFIIDPKVEIQDKVFTLQLFSGNITIYNQIILLAIITLVIYVLKLFVKMTISTKHLAEEYYQKYTLTYFYLALIKDGKLTKEQSDVILGTLFSKADTGLIKNDSSGEIEALQKILFSMKSSS